MNPQNVENAYPENFPLYSLILGPDELTEGGYLKLNCILFNACIPQGGQRFSGEGGGGECPPAPPKCTPTMEYTYIMSKSLEYRYSLQAFCGVTR